MNTKWCVALTCVLIGAAPTDEPVLAIYDASEIGPEGQFSRDESTTEFLRFVLEHDVIEPDVQVELTTANGAIVLRAPAAQHDRVKAFFAQMRARANATTRVSVQLVTLDVRRLVDLSPDGDPVVVKPGINLLTDGFTIGTPALVRPLERCQTALTKDVPCVVAYRAFERLLPLTGRVVVPVVDEIHTGQILNVVIVPLDSKRFAIRLHAEDTKLVEPVASVETDLGPVAVPETHVATVDSTLTLSKDEHALLPIPGAGKLRQAFFVRLWTM